MRYAISTCQKFAADHTYVRQQWQIRASLPSSISIVPKTTSPPHMGAEQGNTMTLDRQSETYRKTWVKSPHMDSRGVARIFVSRSVSPYVRRGGAGMDSTRCSNRASYGSGNLRMCCR